MARLPSTLTTLQRSASTADDVKKLMSAEGASILVVGLPRGLNGQHTAQTEAVQTFGRELEQVVGVPLQWQDEAVTSRKAEAELESRGKPYQKGDIDALSAVYILEDFLRDHPEVS
jgi:putative Holliday junction resolvase